MSLHIMLSGPLRKLKPICYVDLCLGRSFTYVIIFWDILCVFDIVYLVCVQMVGICLAGKLYLFDVTVRFLISIDFFVVQLLRTRSLVSYLKSQVSCLISTTRFLLLLVCSLLSIEMCSF